MPTKTKGRKPGAPKGNKNHFKHGFYSKRFTPEQKAAMDIVDIDDMESEMKYCRVCLDNLSEQISFYPIIRMDNNGSEYRDAHYLQQLNTLTNMFTSLSSMIRTRYLQQGKGGDIFTTIEQAWENIRRAEGQ